MWNFLPERLTEKHWMPALRNLFRLVFQGKCFLLSPVHSFPTHPPSLHNVEAASWYGPWWGYMPAQRPTASKPNSPSCPLAAFFLTWTAWNLVCLDPRRELPGAVQLTSRNCYHAYLQLSSWLRLYAILYAWNQEAALSLATSRKCVL